MLRPNVSHFLQLQQVYLFGAQNKKSDFALDMVAKTNKYT